MQCSMIIVYIVLRTVCHIVCHGWCVCEIVMMSCACSNNITVVLCTLCDCIVCLCLMSVEYWMHETVLVVQTQMCYTLLVCVLYVRYTMIICDCCYWFVCGSVCCKVNTVCNGYVYIMCVKMCTQHKHTFNIMI